MSPVPRYVRFYLLTRSRPLSLPLTVVVDHHRPIDHLLAMELEAILEVYEANLGRSWTVLEADEVQGALEFVDLVD